MMFLSPLNWHYAKFTVFQWKAADTDARRPGDDKVPDGNAERPAGSTDIGEARQPAKEEA